MARILWIESEADYSGNQRVRTQLGSLGHLTIAPSLASARQRLANPQSWDLIITELALPPTAKQRWTDPEPEEDWEAGLKILNDLAKRRVIGQIPILVFTKRGHSGALQRARDLLESKPGKSLHKVHQQ